MKRIIAGGVTLVFALASQGTAQAFAHANRFGGASFHRFGETSHISRFGTSTTHVAGEGTSHRNIYGGSTTHSAWGGTTHTNAWGGTTTGAYGLGAVHTTPYGTTAYASGYRPATGYYGYHPPVTAGYYHPGCYYCGAGAAVAGAAAVGVAAGAAVGAANARAAAANAAVATAGLAMAYPIGAVYAALPGGCVSPSVQGVTYYMCGSTWFKPSFGANGVYYRVVAAP